MSDDDNNNNNIRNKAKSKRGFKDTVDLGASDDKRVAVSIELRKKNQEEQLAVKRRENAPAPEKKFGIELTKADEDMMQKYTEICKSIDAVCNTIANESNNAKNFTAEQTDEKIAYMNTVTDLFLQLTNLLTEGGMTAENQFMKNRMFGCLANFFMFPMPSYVMMMSLLGLMQDLTSGDMGEVQEFMRFTPAISCIIGQMNIDKDNFATYTPIDVELYTTLVTSTMHTLANICADSADARKFILEEHGLILATNFLLVTETNNIDLLRGYSRLICCVLRVKPLPSLEVVADIVKVYDSLMLTNDLMILEMMLSSYYYILSNGDDDHQRLLTNDKDKVEYMCGLLLDIAIDPRRFDSNLWTAMRVHCIKTMNELMLASDVCANVLFEKNIVLTMKEFISNRVISVACNAFLSLGFVASGDRDRANYVLEQGILSDSCLSNVMLGQYDLHRCFIAFLRKMLETVDDATVVKIFGSEFVCKKVCDGLKTKNAGVNLTSLGCARVALECSEGEAALQGGENKVRLCMERHGLFKNLEECEQSENKEVSEDATKIIDAFFSAERDEERAAAGANITDEPKATANTTEYKFENLDANHGLIFGQTPNDAYKSVFGGLAAAFNAKFGDNANFNSSSAAAKDEMKD